MTPSISILRDPIVALAWSVTAASLLYLAVAVLCVWRHGRKSLRPPRPCDPVTILKPVAGAEPMLAQNLAGFCTQTCDDYQVIFGVPGESDPAMGPVRQAMAAAAGRDVSLVVGGGPPASNPKVAALAALAGKARHDILVIADSDVDVDPDYLASVAAPFADPRVGAVTCLYLGVPAGGTASVLAAMYINESFLPAVLVGTLIRPPRYCFGATMAVRKTALEAIGGFAALSPYLADDYMLGKLVAEAGYRVRLARGTVRTVADDRSLAALWRHELRWARTIRSVRPAGQAAAFLTDTLPITVLFALFVAPDAVGAGAVSLAIALRLSLHMALRVRLHAPDPHRPWLIPFRDGLTFAVRIASFLGSRVSWRGTRLAVRPGGLMEHVD